MPGMQAMVDNANAMLNRDMIDRVDPEIAKVLEPGNRLDAAARTLGIARTDAQAAELAKIPEGLQEVIRAAVHSALTRNPRVAVAFAWVRGPWYEFTISEEPDAGGSKGGMTIILRSPRPSASGTQG